MLIRLFSGTRKQFVNAFDHRWLYYYEKGLS